eukprot:CFRG4104T1
MKCTSYIVAWSLSVFAIPSVTATFNVFEERLISSGENVVEITLKEFYSEIEGKHDYDAVILFTTIDPNYGCGMCQTQLNGYKALAQNYRANRVQKSQIRQIDGGEVTGVKEDENLQVQNDSYEREYIAMDAEDNEHEEVLEHDNLDEDIDMVYVICGEDINVNDKKGESESARSGRHGNGVHFLWIDLRTNSKLFQQFNIQKLGTIIVFPANREPGISDRGVMEVVGTNAHQLSEWITSRIGHSHLITPPVSLLAQFTEWTGVRAISHTLSLSLTVHLKKYIVGIFMVGGVGMVMYCLDWKKALHTWNFMKPKMETALTVIVCTTCVLCTSGYLWCMIRGVGLARITSSGGILFIIADSSAALLLIALLQAPKHDSNQYGPLGQRVFFLIFICMLLYSFEVFIYRTAKNPNYTLRLLF